MDKLQLAATNPLRPVTGKSVFDPEFQVSHADCCRLSRVGVIAEEECAMDLQVGRDPVVGINAGQCPGMFNSIKSPE